LNIRAQGQWAHMSLPLATEDCPFPWGPVGG